jgi:ABC-type Fe3+-siderophore transport system permease subunit
MEWFEIERFMTAFMVGSLLSLCGSLNQVCLNNELASPSTLGVDGLSALLVLLFFGAWSFAEKMTGTELTTYLSPYDGAFLAGCLGVGIWELVRRLRPKKVFKQPLATMLLRGISLNLFIGALFSLFHFLSILYQFQFPTQLWFGQIQPLTVFGKWFLPGIWSLIIGWVFLHRFELSVLPLGEPLLRGFGLDSAKLLGQMMKATFIITLFVTAQFGLFSFVGLIFPLLLRQFTFFRGSLVREVTWGAFGAGFVMSIGDAFCYFFPAGGAEIPVGLPLSVLGSLGLFLVLLKLDFLKE